MADEFGGWNWDFSFPDFNWDFDAGAFQFPEFDFSQFAFPEMPAFDWSAFDFGNLPSFSMPDPLALPSFDSNFMSAFDPGQGMDVGGLFSPGGGGSAGPPTSLADLGFSGTSAPQMALPGAGLPQGADPMVNLMGSDQGMGAGFTGLQGDPFNPFEGLGGMPGSPMPGGSAYGLPGTVPPGTSGGPERLAYNQANSATSEAPGLTPQQLMQAALMGKLMGTDAKEPSTWDTVAKMLAAFGPTALGAAGLGLQASNRPERNPLEDELIRAKIASGGLQDTLAKDRLAFEKENAAAQLEAQMAMQAAMLEGRKPGGQANIDALLKGNPQLAALYQALTQQSTGLASGATSPEFNAMVEQIAQVDIAELQRQAQQQIAQAQEMAARQGINPANIIAEVQQRLLQESAKARANARQTLIAQMQPGLNVFNSVGGLFGNLFQTPSA